MRPGVLRKTPCAWLGAALILAAAPAFGQVPQPHISDTSERSGLVTRFVPIEPHLPPDPRRDTFYDTRFGDPPNLRKHPNGIKNGGLYGLRWGSRCTATIVPFFYGTPGGAVTPDCVRGPKVLRYAQGIVKPFKPVGMYYDQGAYVPVYDLDPFVPGPGAYPWPWYYRGPRGG